MNSFDEVRTHLESLSGLPPEQRWASVAELAITARLPFDQCRQLWQAAFADWDPQQGPWPVWTPTPAGIANANATQFMQQQGLATLQDLRHWATSNPVRFWQTVCQQLKIQFQRPPEIWLDDRQGLAHAVWGVGAELNIVLSCLPELGAEVGEQLDPQRTAIVWQPVQGPLQKISAQQLADQVQRVAVGWHRSGWRGKRVALIMPLTPISVVVYLAALYSGSTVISIADSFSSPEIANRLQLAGAELVVTYDQLARGEKYLPLLPRVQQATELPCLVVGGGPLTDQPDRGRSGHTAGPQDWDPTQPDRGRSGQTAERPWLGSPTAGLRSHDLDWNAWLPTDESLEPPPPAQLSAQAPIHLLFSSGTTGDPKVIPWTSLTPIKCAADGFFHQDIHPSDVVAWPTNLGWMMGPWLIFASLINRAPMALYEDAPLGSGFGKFIQDANVTILGLVPSMVKAWRATAAMEEFDWTRVRLFSSTGESSQRDDYFYLSWLAGFKPIIEYCGGTEIGGGYISSTVVENNAPATFTGPAIGLDVEILNPAGQAASEGELYIVPPSIGLSQSLLNRDHFQTYYAEAPRSPSGRVLRKHGDHFRQLPGGYYEAGGRTDDTMNLGGIKVSSLELERAINLVPGVRESAAVACSLHGGPDTLVVFLVLADANTELPSEAKNNLPTGTNPAGHSETDDAWLLKLNRVIREQLNPLFKVGQVCIVSQLPRTASNKILRRKLRDQWQQGRDQ